MANILCQKIESPFIIKSSRNVRNYFLMSEWMFFCWNKKSGCQPSNYQEISAHHIKWHRHWSSLICCRSNWTERVLGRDALATVVPAKFELNLLKDVQRNMCQLALMNNWRSGRILINDCYYPSCCSGILRGQYHFIPLCLAQIFFAGEGGGCPYFWLSIIIM